MVRALMANMAAIYLLFLVTGCASDTYISANSDILNQSKKSETIKEYLIGVDDTVNINVWRNAELSVSVPVRPDGKISMPLIGDVRAAGYTPEQVSQAIQNKLKDYVRDPNVTLMVTGLRSHEYLTRLRITGAVANPSSLNYRQGMTVLDAILAAGSVNDFAAPNDTKLYREINGKIRVISIYLDDILNKGRLETNIHLRPGDILTVPERLF
ncbi:FIG123464: Polysaccharide export protein [hydrothermal vent metagenome]|uniref:FIG123464: Polysaccharide export protein n=1 Tax=hydrothermal vent metagenome TaxID=652676 RepID=A0A3B0XQN7_9ZZZZ